MDPVIVTEITRQVPLVLAIVLVAVFGYRHRAGIEKFLRSWSNVRVQAGMFSAEFGKQLQADLRTARPEVDPRAGVGDEIAERARDMAPLLQRSNILWIDDEPGANRLERGVLHQLGVYIETVRNTQEAIDALARRPPWTDFDLVISDIGRGETSAGLTDLPRLRSEAGLRAPVIFYVTSLEPGTPEDAYGITNRPDTLLELVLDALERRPPPVERASARV